MTTYRAQFSGRDVHAYAALAGGLRIVGDPQGDNNARASFGAVALSAFIQHVGKDVPETELADLLADLMHLADAMGLDFDSALATAERNHREELRGEF